MFLQFLAVKVLGTDGRSVYALIPISFGFQLNWRKSRVLVPGKSVMTPRLDTLWPMSVPT